MATEEITISELELADEVLADMTLPVDTATETRAVTLKQLRAWLGSSLPTGFIIPAVGKISDERFTLLDGKTLSRAGTYEAFCNKVVSEVQAGNWFACSEDEYNSDISTYGQCGKFVVSNDYIRIPTINRFIGATVTLSEIGKTYKESLPNITGSASWGANGVVNAGFGNQSAYSKTTGALSLKNTGSNYGGIGATGIDTVGATEIDFNASDSSSTYKNGAKVQPDHTKYPYYMVISTEGQTANIEIDINQVYEDLELKANKNLSNLTAEGKSLASGLGMPSDRYIGLSLGASGTTYTAPANGWFIISKYPSSSGQSLYMFNQTKIFGVGGVVYGTERERLYLPVQKGDIIDVTYSFAGNTDQFNFIYAEGEN